MATAKDHVHRYIRAVGRITKANKDSGFVDYYKCGDPDCSHYLKADLILGKRSICNKCGEEFILPVIIRGLTNRPHCKKCTRRRSGRRGKFVDNATSMDDYLDMAHSIKEE